MRAGKDSSDIIVNLGNMILTIGAKAVEEYK